MKRELGCFIGVNLLLLLFALYSFGFWNGERLLTLNYPVDSYGNSCFTTFAKTYPYLYIDLDQKEIRYRCVN